MQCYAEENILLNAHVKWYVLTILPSQRRTYRFPLTVLIPHLLVAMKNTTTCTYKKSTPETTAPATAVLKCLDTPYYIPSISSPPVTHTCTHLHTHLKLQTYELTNSLSHTQTTKSKSK